MKNDKIISAKEYQEMRSITCSGTPKAYFLVNPFGTGDVLKHH